MKTIFLPVLASQAGLLRSRVVQGRAAGATASTRNEILTTVNKLGDFKLAIVKFDRNCVSTYCVSGPFRREPGFDVTRVNYSELLARSMHPS